MVLAHKGIDIFYTDEGTGEALVFLHGFLENSNMWQGLIPSFSKQRRVVCIDLLGHGNSGNIGYIHTMEMMADAVLAVLNHLTIKRAIFIGHSMGGYVCLALAKMESHRIQKLILLNSTWESDTPEKKLIRSKTIQTIKNSFEAFVKLSIPNLFADKNRVKFKNEIAEIRDQAMKMSQEGVIAALEGMKIRLDYAKIVKDFEFERYIIVGKEDTFVNVQKILAEAENLGIIPRLLDGGHMSHIENRTETLLILAEIVHK
jgi:pimeloyl-ACP methyl ester carboxylesterase